MGESLIGCCGMVIMVLRMRRSPHQLTLPLFPTTYQLINIPAMSHSNLRDAVPFQFLSSRVARETITPWDRCKFPCAWANSMVTYPTDTEVLVNFILPLLATDKI